MQRNFRKPHKPFYIALLRWLSAAMVLLACGLFLDWLIINLLLGCCEGGVCWPDNYPQCRNAHYGEFYGQDH